MKIKLRTCREIEVPSSLKILIDKINKLNSKLLHSIQNENFELDPSVLSQLDVMTKRFYKVMEQYIEQPKLYDLYGYYLYKFNGERNVLKHPQYKLKFV